MHVPYIESYKLFSNYYSSVDKFEYAKLIKLHCKKSYSQIKIFLTPSFGKTWKYIFFVVVTSLIVFRNVYIKNENLNYFKL